MSPLHINMTNVFHTGRPRGSITTPTAVPNGARAVALPRGMVDGFKKLKRIFSTYLGFVGPGILISIAYMVINPLLPLYVRTTSQCEHSRVPYLLRITPFTESPGNSLPRHLSAIRLLRDISNL